MQDRGGVVGIVQVPGAQGLAEQAGRVTPGENQQGELGPQRRIGILTGHPGDRVLGGGVDAT